MNEQNYINFGIVEHRDIVDRLRRECWCDMECCPAELCEPCGAVQEIEKLRSLVKELLPFMVIDVKAGLGICEPPPEHPVDDCPDCVWYTTSVEWQKRIDSGEFADYMGGRMKDSIVVRWVDRVIGDGTAEDAIALMEHLRAEATRLDRHLADPRHQWNRIRD